MKKNFVPRVFIGAALMASMALNSHKCFGDDLTEDQKKEQALKQVELAATKAAEKALPDLLKSGLSKDEAKATIKSIIQEAMSTITIKDFDGTDKTIEAVFKAFQTQHDALALEIKNNGGIKIESVQEQVSKFINDNHEKIKSTYSAGHGVLELEIKAVGNMTTGAATNPDGIPALMGVQSAPPQRVNLRATIINSLVTNFSTSLAAYPYTESIPKDGDFSFVAEGAAKPQLDFKIETRYASPVKAAGWIGLTEESIKDIPGLQSIATGYLKDKHDIRKQKGILFGSGVSPNPKGATLYGRAFVAGSMALKVRFPNIMDVINAGITDVFTTHNYQDEMPYQPSLALVNPVDFFIEFVSAKDERGLPLYPSASMFNQVVIGGVTIMPEQDIPAGKVFIADMSKYNVSDYVGYTVKIGWINDDFIKNQFVMLGESRFHAFVRKLDQQAFIYDDIATIKTAITKPEAAAA